MVQRAVQVTWDDRPNFICSSKQFGPSSEKSVELEEQTSLFNEPETLADPKAAEPDLEQIVYKRKKQAGKRELDFSKLPTEQIVHELPEGEQKRLSFHKRFQARKEYSFPIAEEFFAWAKNEYDRNPVPKSAYGAALTYAVKQKEWLMHVFLDGRLELSNNRAERAE